MLPRFIITFLFSASLVEHAILASAPFSEFERLATQEKAVLGLVDYARTSEEANGAGEQAIVEGEKEIQRIIDVKPEARTFENTFAAADYVSGAISELDGQMQTVAETHSEKAVRDAARAVSLKLEQWLVGVTYREDLYQVLRAVAESKPKVGNQERRQVELAMRDYRRAGMSLPVSARKEAEKLQKKLASMNTQFHENINEARAPLDFTAEELDGVPDSFLNAPGVKQPDGRFRVMANITLHSRAIQQNAKRAEVRKRVLLARSRLAREKNVPLLNELIQLRAEIARRLGYRSWADYQIEIKMAGNGARAIAFEQDLVEQLEGKFNAEKTELRALKAKETGNPYAQLEPWDIEYYTERLLKERFAVDSEALRIFFPYQQTLDGMMAIYQRIFGLKFTEVEPPYRWAPGVQLYVVQDAGTRAVMGAFYLDMFPREGKYNHFACFPQKMGRELAGGGRQLPIMALLCNFQPAAGDKPSLLKHSEVEILFHEFGHAIHGLTSWSRFSAQGAFSVPGDFVEAPSQMLENWVWQKNVLDTFAADYRDFTRKIPRETVDAMVRARQATEGLYSRRQLALGVTDLEFHSVSPERAKQLDAVGVAGEVEARVYFAPPADTAFIAYVGHMAGYDAGYYGYLWAKSLSLDMASVFRHSQKGFLDETIGRRLRNEVYGVGFTRDVNVSVERFLGRQPSPEPFLEYLGVKKSP